MSYLQHRSSRLFNRIYKLKDSLKLTLEPKESFIPAHHRADFSPNDLTLTAEEEKAIGKMTYIPEQYRNMQAHYRKAVAERYLKYYDIEILPMKQVEPVEDYEVYSKEVMDKIYSRKRKQNVSGQNGDGK